MPRSSYSKRPLVDRLVRELAAGRRPGPLLVLWRWRWECLLALALTALVLLAPSALTLLTLGALAGCYVTMPPVRQFVDGRFWGVATQHRLREGFRGTNLRSSSGRMPAILWTSTRGNSQRVLVSCPAGLDLERLGEVRGELAAACWAADVLVVRHPRYANLVVVLVVRTHSPGGRTP